MQVDETNDALSKLILESVDLGRQSDATHGESSLLVDVDMRVVSDVGKAMDQCAGINSKGREVAVALDAALNLDTVREWVVRCSHMAEKVIIV